MTSVEPPRPRHDRTKTRVRAWVGDAVAAAIIIASAFVPFPDTHFHPGDPLAAALVVAPAAILPLRRRWPIPVLGVGVVLYVVAAFGGMLWPGIVLAIAIAMFGVGNRSSRRTTLITGLATIVIVILTNVIASLGSVLDPRVFALGITLAFAAAAGDATRSRREYITAITERAKRAEETRESEVRRSVSEERLRIARDLHDAVAHQIAVISLNAGVASSAIESRPAAAQEAVRTIRSAARTVLGEIGALLEVLRTDDDADTVTPPPPGLERLHELIEQFEDGGLAVTLRTEGDLLTLGGAPTVTAYRVIQEGLTNAHKHGSEARAHVWIRRDHDALKVIVTNAAIATPVERAPAVDRDDSRSGLGLIGLRERVAAVRGTVEAGPTPGGWRLSASLPITPEDER